MPEYTTTYQPHDLYETQHLTRWPVVSPKAKVVLVHGLAEHAGRYGRSAEQLAKSGYEVVAPDLFGFGRSGGPRGDVRAWDDYLDQVLDLIQSERADDALPVVLMGHSLGGLICASYCISSRPSPDLLVLSAPALAGGAWWQRSLAGVLAAVAGSMLVPNNLDGSQLSRDPDVGEAYFSDPLVFTKTSARLGSALFKAQERVLGGLESLTVPTLVLHGGGDTIVPAKSTAVLGDLPNVQRRLYPKLRHEILNEPEGPELVAEIVDWLDGELAKL